MFFLSCNYSSSMYFFVLFCSCQSVGDYILVEILLILKKSPGFEIYMFFLPKDIKSQWYIGSGALVSFVMYLSCRMDRNTWGKETYSAFALLYLQINIFMTFSYWSVHFPTNLLHFSAARQKGWLKKRNKDNIAF